MSDGYVYTQGDIIVEPFVFTEVLDLKIERILNEHAKLNVSGIIPNDDLDKYVEIANENSYIKVSVKDDENNIKDLFQGMVTNIGIRAINDVRNLEIEALSNTFAMDIERKSRSFQGENLTYTDIFNAVNSAYGDIQLVDNSSNGQTIEKIIVQFNETDWEFMKRLASHFNVKVLSECILPGIKYTIGRAEGTNEYNLEEFNYSINKGLKEYQVKLSNNNYELDDMNLITYEVRTTTILDLYNTIKFKDRTLYVYKCEEFVEEGILYCRYVLRDEKGMRIRRICNDKIAGMSLNAKILACQQDVVKLSLEIDGYPSGDDNTVWLPYSTVFSSPDGTGWYCMPEVGDAIRLYFPDNEERNSYAISSVNLKSRDVKRRSDPAVKNIATKYGKEVIMRPGAVEIIANGQLFMKLTDEKGIEIVSDKKIMLDAKEDVVISGKTISVSGKDSVVLAQGQAASVKIENDVTMYGSKIKTQ